MSGLKEAYIQSPPIIRMDEDTQQFRRQTESPRMHMGINVNKKGKKNEKGGYGLTFNPNSKLNSNLKSIYQSMKTSNS